MLARQITLSGRTPSTNSFVRMPLPPLVFSCLPFSTSRRLFSIVCSLFLQKLGGWSIPVPLRPSRRVPINPFASYHIHVTPAVSGDYALFCATATSQTIAYQEVTHSF